jgi:two-component system response regulator AtoC
LQRSEISGENQRFGSEFNTSGGNMASAVQIPPGTVADHPAHESATLSFMPIRTVEPILAKIATSSVPVLIQGETGAGKEVVARRLHLQSGRAGKPFLKLNCAALQSELAESGLFGHERGGFTGVLQQAPGMFELAAGGTLLLDEIGDMELKSQAKLLQVLQDQEFQAAGGKQAVHCNLRFLAATHSNLQTSVTEKRFRPDLFYRLNVVSISIPPLRERRDEIIPLAEFLIEKHTPITTATRLPAEVCRALVSYSWPGNVRELDNVIRRWLLLLEVEPILRYLEPDESRSDSGLRDGPDPNAACPRAIVPRSSRRGLHDVKEANRLAEIEAILAALNAAHWNRRKAAISLGVDYRSLLYKMKKLGLDHNLYGIGNN